MSAAAATVTRLRSLIRIHDEHAAKEREGGRRSIAEAHEDWSAGYTSALEVLLEEMELAGEEVPS